MSRASFSLSSLVALAAFCSGAASLTLEVVWSKALVVPLGNSSDATALVLAGFMLGIACGAWLGARLARDARRALYSYAGLELLLAVFASFVPSLLACVTEMTAPTWLPLWPWVGFASRFLAAITLIVVPCLVMGSTLPLLMTSPGEEQKSARAAVGWLYGANTLGATLAATVTGFVGVANWGVRGCSRRAALCSVAAAAFGVLSQLRTPQQKARSIGAAPSRALQTTRGGTDRNAIAAAFLSGFVLLAAEVFWARILTFVFGHDTYAFATLLGVVLLGLALGGMLFPAFAKGAPQRVAGWAIAGVSVTLLVSFYVASWLSIRHGRDPFSLGDRFADRGALSVEMLREFAYTPILALLPCVCSGIAYPATIAMWAGRDRSMSRATGSIGLINGLGATTGASLTALGLVGWIGVQGVVSCLALLAGVTATWLLAAPSDAERETIDESDERRLLAASPPATPAATRATPPATRATPPATRATPPATAHHIDGRIRRLLAALPLSLVVLAVVCVPGDLPRRMLLAVVGPRHQQLLYYEEARTATVSVIENDIHGERQLLVNAVNEVTTRLVHDQSFKLLGQLGPLLHPDPKQAVMICLGAGLAAGSALSHPLERLEVVDLLRAVRHGASFFPEENNHVLEDPRLLLRVDDGRQHLLSTRARYDLAIVDSTHPKSVDSWILYTREFFALLRSRLAPSGIVVQWLPLHGLSEREFMAVVATFASVFPQMTLWASVGYETYGQVGYAKLVGQRSDDPMRIDVRRMESRLASPKVQHDLGRYGMGRIPEILDQFVAGPERIRAWVRGLPTLGDDRPFLAYLTALTLGPPMTPNRLLAVRESVRPFLERPESIEPESMAEIERAFDAQGLVISGQLERARAYYPTGEKIRYYVAQTKTSLPYYEALASKYRDDAERLFEAGTQLGTLGHADVAATIYAAALPSAPRSLRLRLNSGLLALAANQPQRAGALFADLLLQHPNLALLHQNLGAALLAQGEAGAAKRAWSTALRLDPRSIGAMVGLADAEMALGNWAQAQQLLEAALRREPRQEGALSRMARASEAMGDHAKALRWSEAAASIDPYRVDLGIDWGQRLLESRPEQALAIAGNLERFFPDHAGVTALRGSACARLGQWQNAALAFVLALEQDPRSANAAFGLGQALARLGRRIEAKSALCLADKLGAQRPRVVAELQLLGEKAFDCAFAAAAR